MSPCREGVRSAATVHGAILLLAFSGWHATSAQGLSRLFSTPQERARLDDVRRAGDAVAAMRRQSGDAGATSSGRPTVTRVTVQGMVLRSRGRGSVWIKAEPVSAQGGVSREGMLVEVRPDARGRVAIAWPDGTSMQLRPGQRFDLATGAVLESYQIEVAPDGASSVHDRSPQTWSGEEIVDGVR